MKLQRVAIVESSAIIAEGVATILGRTNRVDVVGIYATLAEVLPLVTASKVDAIIADVALYRHSAREIRYTCQSLPSYLYRFTP